MKVRTAIGITAGIIAAEIAITWFAMRGRSAILARHWPPNRWHIELGNLSEALAAIATASAAFVALWIAGREPRDRMREREDEDRTHARLVYLDVRLRTVVLRSAREGVPVVEVTVRNFGPFPVLDVEVSDAIWKEHSDAHWRSNILSGRSYNILRPHSTDNSFEEMREFGVEFLRPDEDQTVVPVTGHYPGGNQLPIYAAIDLSNVVIKVQFTTASGVRWETAIQGDSRGEPVRV
jgi:hypothetical protein